MFKQIIFVLDAELYFPEYVVIGAAKEKDVQEKAEADKRQAKQGASGTYSVQSLRNSNLPIPSMLFI